MRFCVICLAIQTAIVDRAFSYGSSPPGFWVTPQNLWGDGNFLCVPYVPLPQRISIVSDEREDLALTIGSESEFWTDGTHVYFTSITRVQRVNLATGEIQTLAGKHLALGSEDSIGEAARFGWARN